MSLGTGDGASMGSVHPLVRSGAASLESSPEVLQKLNMELPWDLAILSQVYPQENLKQCTLRNWHTTFIAA